MTLLTVTRHDDPPDTMTIALDPPIAYRGGELAEVTLKEPTARQVREAEREMTPEAPWAGMLAYELKLIGLVAGLPAPALELLPIGLANLASVFLQEFVTKGAPEADAEADADAGEDAPPEATTLPIDPPLAFNGVSYAELDLREPLASEIRKARQLVRTPGSLFESRRAQMALVTAVSGLPAPVIDALPISRLNEAARLLSRFITAGRPTGKR